MLSKAAIGTASATAHFVPLSRHSPTENAARGINGRFAEPHRIIRLGRPAAGLGRPCRSCMARKAPIAATRRLAAKSPMCRMLQTAQMTATGGKRSFAALYIEVCYAGSSFVWALLPDDRKPLKPTASSRCTHSLNESRRARSLKSAMAFAEETPGDPPSA